MICIKKNGSLVQVDDTSLVANYNSLSNQPKINGVVLSGDKTSGDLGLSGTVYSATEPTDPATDTIWIGNKTL